MTGRVMFTLLTVLVLSASPLGCSEDTEKLELQKATDELSASILRPQAEQAFDRKGHPIDGGLRCGADTEGSGQLSIECTGATEEQQEAHFRGSIDVERLTSRSSGDDGIPGSYTGTVGGEEVFRMNCFECAPENAS